MEQCHWLLLFDVGRTVSQVWANPQIRIQKMWQKMVPFFWHFSLCFSVRGQLELARKKNLEVNTQYFVDFEHICCEELSWSEIQEIKITKCWYHRSGHLGLPPRTPVLFCVPGQYLSGFRAFQLVWWPFRTKLKTHGRFSWKKQVRGLNVPDFGDIKMGASREQLVGFVTP